MRRLLLILMTVLVLFAAVSILRQSVSAPQPRTQLELKQVDLTLQVLALRSDPDYRFAVESLGANELVADAIRLYREVSPEDLVLIKLGLLEAAGGKPQMALRSWAKVAQGAALYPTAQVLGGLWRSPPRLLPNAETTLNGSLTGWYRTQALGRLYELEQRTDQRRRLEADSREQALQVLGGLVWLGALPLAGSFTGVVILVGWLIWQRKQSPPGWQVPWSGETLWAVVVIWFAAFLVSGTTLAPVLSSLGIETASLDATAQSLVILGTYALGAGTGLLALWWLVWRPYSGHGQFRYNLVPGWWKWGLGGYFVATPLVLLASLLSQQLWSAGGGGNPLLEIISGSDTPVARLVLLGTVSVVAPFFEETLFRGLVFPTLASRWNVPLAIVGSALLFALAHLNASDLLPLTVLGMVLATLYHYTRTLAPCILLHALWNGASFVSLLVLGG